MQSEIVYTAKILLPDKNVDYEKWSVIACDQFTSEPSYWQTTKQLVGDAPSALNIILPEVYLETQGVDERIKQINKTMQNYKNNVLTNSFEGMMYIERTTAQNKVRAGLVAAIDLEDYSFEKGKAPLIRPSENTVVQRIPPRLAVRRNAPLESPHIMMLVDDDKKTIIEPITQNKQMLTQMYDTQLMQGGGSIKGWAITETKMLAQIKAAFKALASQAEFDKKYPDAKGNKPIAMAVGDGNHSLATAKAYWQELKTTLSPEEMQNHPARMCLVEIVNIHSKSIEIEPIHRVIFGATQQQFITASKQFFENEGVKIAKDGEHKFVICTKSGETQMNIKNSKWAIPTATIEAFLDNFTANNANVKVDYIHGADTVKRLAQEGAIGILLPPIKKSDLFYGVVMGGVLPRKTFSMGHAEEKRYYMECKSIKKV